MSRKLKTVKDLVWAFEGAISAFLATVLCIGIVSGLIQILTARLVIEKSVAPITILIIGFLVSVVCYGDGENIVDWEKIDSQLMVYCLGPVIVLISWIWTVFLLPFGFFTLIDVLSVGLTILVMMFVIRLHVDGNLSDLFWRVGYLKGLLYLVDDLNLALARKILGEPEPPVSKPGKDTPESPLSSKL